MSKWLGTTGGWSSNIICQPATFEWLANGWRKTLQAKFEILHLPKAFIINSIGDYRHLGRCISTDNVFICVVTVFCCSDTPTSSAVSPPSHCDSSETPSRQREFLLLFMSFPLHFMELNKSWCFSIWTYLCLATTQDGRYSYFYFFLL